MNAMDVDSQTMEEILQSVRNVIYGDTSYKGDSSDEDDDFLEYENDDDFPYSGNEFTANNNLPTEKSVLDDIDAALNTHTPQTYTAQIPNTSKSRSLLAEDSAEESSQAIKNLLNKVQKTNNIDSTKLRSGTFLEDLVIEAMQPFLSEWLNKNLPNMVKKIVEREIKRLLPREDDV